MEEPTFFSKIFGRFRSIQSTMMISFSSLMAVAVLIFLMIALNFTSQTIYENSNNYTSQIVRQVNYDIDAYIDYMENISTVMSKSGDISMYLFEDQQKLEEVDAERERIVSQFSTIMDSRQDIYNIAAIAENGRYVINRGTDILTPYVDIRKLDWYQAAMDSPTGIAVSSSHVQNAIQSSYKWVITLSRVLQNNRTGEKEGLFFIDLNYSAISDLCNNNTIGNKGYIFVLDDKGNVIYHPKQQLMYGGIHQEAISEIMECEEDSLVVRDGIDRKMYTLSRSDKTGWTVVGATYTSELMKNNKQARMLYSIAAAILILAVLLMSNILSREITKPLRSLTESMSRVEKGEFDKANVDVTMENEIGSLGKSYNLITERIHTLMEQNVYEQKQKRKNELKALQAQINPHFLYNTLDSIIWMSEAGQNDEVVEMTSALAKLLRQSISNDHEQVELSQEMEYVRNYLTIQKMRYQDKLEYSIQIQPVVRHVKIVKLVLQPIVENAIYHGIKYKNSKGTLKISAYPEGKDVCISVEDDGIGMDEETLNNIFDGSKKNYKQNGVGVSNVQKRLKLYYGERYGVSYESKTGIGTRAIIRIPQHGGQENEKME